MLKGALILIKILKDKHRKREQSELLDGDTVGLEQRLEVGERLLSDSEDRDPAPGLHDVVLEISIASVVRWSSCALQRILSQCSSSRATGCPARPRGAHRRAENASRQ